jgi:hypothetical protein
MKVNKGTALLLIIYISTDFSWYGKGKRSVKFCIMASVGSEH